MKLTTLHKAALLGIYLLTVKIDTYLAQPLKWYLLNGGKAHPNQRWRRCPPGGLIVQQLKLFQRPTQKLFWLIMSSICSRHKLARRFWVPVLQYIQFLAETSIRGTFSDNIMARTQLCTYFSTRTFDNVTHVNLKLYPDVQREALLLSIICRFFSVSLSLALSHTCLGKTVWYIDQNVRNVR